MWFIALQRLLMFIECLLHGRQFNKYIFCGKPFQKPCEVDTIGKAHFIAEAAESLCDISKTQ